MGFGNILSGVSDGVALLFIAGLALFVAFSIFMFHFEQKRLAERIRELEWKILIIYDSVFGERPKEFNLTQNRHERKYVYMRVLELEQALKAVELVILQKCSEAATREDFLSSLQNLEQFRNDLQDE